MSTIQPATTGNCNGATTPSRHSRIAEDATSTYKDLMRRCQRRLCSPNTPLRVLVVDDDVDGTDTLVALLRMCGCCVRGCYGGDEALEIVQTYQPEVVLLDIGMPGMDGFEVARNLRELDEGREAVLIAITGYDHAACHILAKQIGYYQYLLKPANPDELLDLLLAVTGYAALQRTPCAERSAALHQVSPVLRACEDRRGDLVPAQSSCQLPAKERLPHLINVAAERIEIKGV